jgi:hypothetical protein
VTKITTTRKNADANVRIRTAYARLAALEVAQGWTDDQDPEDVTVAAINYFGAPAANIPPRDALTPAVQKTRRSVRNVTERAGRAANRGEFGPEDLQPLADGAKANLRIEIRAFSDPANAPATIKKKGRDDPLIGADGAGRILNSAGAVVRKKR